MKSGGPQGPRERTGGIALRSPEKREVTGGTFHQSKAKASLNEKGERTKFKGGAGEMGELQRGHKRGEGKLPKKERASCQAHPEKNKGRGKGE